MKSPRWVIKVRTPRGAIVVLRRPSSLALAKVQAERILLKKPAGYTSVATEDSIWIESPDGQTTYRMEHGGSWKEVPTCT